MAEDKIPEHVSGEPLLWLADLANPSSRLLVTASSFDEVVRVVEAPRAPSESLRDLLAGRPLEDAP